ncbi:hypothetical protein PanWU01x14_026180 [Parasponia andersonii]|uniref:Uncharacterized protein n=1 Tax=Parasponia andersonii TaxID=3476 RepID=A0A2P5DVZ3_PARAD|nr:hypothetical protein PanWU01x14_026180 [Parasponia andersonii]
MEKVRIEFPTGSFLTGALQLASFSMSTSSSKFSTEFSFGVPERSCSYFLVLRVFIPLSLSPHTHFLDDEMFLQLSLVLCSVQSLFEILTADLRTPLFTVLLVPNGCVDIDLIIILSSPSSLIC